MEPKFLNEPSETAEPESPSFRRPSPNAGGRVPIENFQNIQSNDTSAVIHDEEPGTGRSSQ